MPNTLDQSIDIAAPADRVRNLVSTGAVHRELPGRTALADHRMSDHVALRAFVLPPGQVAQRTLPVFGARPAASQA
jgi:hypothetical protein